MGPSDIQGQAPGWRRLAAMLLAGSPIGPLHRESEGNLEVVKDVADP
jgi:hypothetical protein